MSLNTASVGATGPVETFRYGPRDCILYALGVGAGPDDLAFVYEGADPFRVLPTFGVLPAFSSLAWAVAAAGIDPLTLLHGEQDLVAHDALPAEGTLTTVARITGVYDKGRHGLVTGEARSTDETGRLLVTNRFSLVARFQGGFGGPASPETVLAERPPRSPDHLVEQATTPSQALLYRLCGDLNPLHVDPGFAVAAGFERPILHGLCTFGMAARAVLMTCCDADPRRFRRFVARFSAVMYPGDTLRTEMWRCPGGTVAVQAVSGRGATVLKNALAEVA